MSKQTETHEPEDPNAPTGYVEVFRFPKGDPDWLPRWELFGLPTGDLIALLLFAIIGRASHDVGDVGPVLGTINTAMPFLVAWLITGMFTGMYRGQALYPLKRVIWRTLLTGLFAGPIGVALRALYLDAPIIPSFVLVATLSSTAIMLVWRVTWSRFRRLWWPELP